ncbi:C40 family peptidase [Arthrobacter sp. LAPM80]|uniref:C40 family peptidase n=1 Tax=Arthrobacter sp. LAPM80 TaxID=3141788 RepID=UPI00398AC0B3
MTMRFLVRGTTALACAAVASTAFLAPANAAPPHISTGMGALGATLGTTALQPFTLRPFSPAIPSEGDIAKAKESEAAAAAASTQLDAIISSANDRLQASSLVAMGANNAYTSALVTLEQRKGEADTAEAKAKAAASAQQKAKAQLGQLAGNLYKNGGLGLDVQTFLTSSDADDAMYQASTLMTLGTSRAHTFDTAEATAATSVALQAQAKEASKAASDATAAAESSRAQAQVAADAQAAIVAENQAQRDILLQRLATLHNTTVALEGARVDELARKAQEQVLRQQIEESQNAPAPVRPPTAGQKPLAGPAVPPAVPKPPVTQAPQPPAPQVPRPPVTQAPQPPAPQAPKPPAPPVGSPPVAPPVVQPPAPSGSYTQVMVNYAMSKIGGPYQWGGNGPTAFDCSGLVQQAFAAAGKSVPREGTDQFWAAPQRVPLSQMRYGDLLVFDDDGSGRFGHIAIYVGNNQVVQALYYGYPIQVTPLANMPTMKLYPYAARY